MARHRRQTHKVELNLTSMMDIVFQLIVFFLLVTNFSAQELPKLEPPDPFASRAREPSQENKRLMINVVPDSSGIRAASVRVRAFNIDPGAYDQLTSLIQVEREQVPEGQELEIDLRADRKLHYNQVQPVMDAITKAGVSRINLVALTPKSGGASQ